jgi:ABC-type protease/lipase transport system fused ATPase/permease subunit
MNHWMLQHDLHFFKRSALILLVGVHNEFSWSAHVLSSFVLIMLDATVYMLQIYDRILVSRVK